MFLACYTRRQEKRQELAVETALERQLEGEPSDVPPEASQNARLVAAMHVPLERNLAAPAADRIKKRFPADAWNNLDLPGTPLISPNIKWPLGLARFRTPQWKYPIAILEPLIWYWTRILFHPEPELLEGNHGKGVSWIELAVDFEIATRVPLSARGPDNANETIRMRADLMADATKALIRGLGLKLKHQTTHTRSIQAFGTGERRAGLRYRPALLQPEAVGLELGLQVMLHPILMGDKYTQWKWMPNYRHLTPLMYKPMFVNMRIWLHRKTRLRAKTRIQEQPAIR